MNNKAKLPGRVEDGLDACLLTVVLDKPGQGNACHEYQIRRWVADYEDDELCRITFQNGPIKEHGVNGISNEALLKIVIHRLEGFQSGDYACRENALALTKLQESLMWLEARTKNRIERGVEGTHVI